MSEPDPPSDSAPSPSGFDVPRSSDLLAVFLTAGAVTALQIALTRVFSITLWHHFAHLVVGIALLGFGIAGTWLSLRQQCGKPLFTPARLALGASWISLLAWLSALVLRPNPLELLRSPSVGFSLVLLVILTTLPFLGAGLVIGSALSRWRFHTARVYGADLLGAGALGVVAIVLLPEIGALGLLGGGTALLALSACLLSRQAAERRRGMVALALIAVATWFVQKTEDSWLLAAATKEITFYHRPDLGQHTIEHRVWTVNGRIDVSREGPAPPITAGDLPRGTAPHPLRIVSQDGSAPTGLHRIDSDPSELRFMENATTSAVWKLRGARFGPRGVPDGDGARVLVIGAGGGVDVNNALAHGARRVVGVDVNGAILDLNRRHFPAYGGNLVQRSGVELVHSEGRAYVARSREHFDVIQLAGVDTFTALASGAYSLAEAYVYTQEAFEAYVDRLSPEGCISVSRLILKPPRETLRLAVTAAAALRSRGVSAPEGHLIVLGGGTWASLVACRQPIARTARDRVTSFAAQHGYSVAYDPFAPGDGPFARALTGDAATRQAFIDAYPYRITPATDERPFFFDYFRWRNLENLRLLKTESVYSSPVPIGHAVALFTLLVTSVLAAFGILWPLRRRRPDPGERGHARRTIAVFACLGTGYLLVEIAFLQRLTALVGKPTVALTVTLCALLVASGVGALLSGRLGAARSRRVVLALPPLLLVLWAISVWGLPRLMGLTDSQRILVAVLMVVPPGLLMGIPFPTALAALARRDAPLVPWAFAINAFATVVTASLAQLLAMEIGFSALLLLAAPLYVAVLVLWPSSPLPRPSTTNPST